MCQIDKITRAVLQGTDTKGNEIEIIIPRVTDMQTSTSFSDEEIEFSLFAIPDRNNNVFQIRTKGKKGETKPMKGVLIYCRFSNSKYEFDLNTKLYAYYMPIAPKDLYIGIGTIFAPIDYYGAEMYKNTYLRCEQILGVESIQDAEFLTGIKLKTINRIKVIKHSNFYKNKNIHYHCDEERIGYVIDGIFYSFANFWTNMVRYDNTAEDKCDNTKNSTHVNPFTFIPNECKDKPCCINNNNNKGEMTMEKKNIFGSMFKNVRFGEIDSTAVKYSFKGIALQTYEGDYVVYNDDFTFTNVGDMVIDIPVFVMPVTKKDLKKGDIIMHNGDYVIVNAVADNEINVARPWNKEIISIIPEKSIFGFGFYTKVINPFESFNVEANEQNPFGNMMPLLFLNNNEDNSMKNMMLMMMLNNNGGGDTNKINPFLMYAMMDSEDMNPLMLLAMTGNNPFTSLMGNPTE